MNYEDLWIKEGCKFSEWIMKVDEDRRGVFVALLQKTASETNLPQPKLILGRTLMLLSGESKCSNKTAQLFAEALDPRKWVPFSKPKLHWLNNIGYGLLVYSRFLLERGLVEKSHKLGETISKYPWASVLYELNDITRDGLEIVLRSSGNMNIVLELSHSLVRKNVKWGWPYFFTALEISSNSNPSKALKEQHLNNFDISSLIKT